MDVINRRHEHAKRWKKSGLKLYNSAKHVGNLLVNGNF